MMDPSTTIIRYRGHLNKEFKLWSTFSNDDSLIVSGSEDGDVYIWDLEDAKVQHVIKKHTGMVSCVSYHPTEMCMLTGSTDKSINLYYGSKVDVEKMLAGVNG
eukprot:TRINITY_DN4186_c0_g2_i1.p1 TRINITY_DN4186_c0_g2~~TRINITY_DN4186_c0_g2_i1.p1  ORF type:complete len:103 (-),score=9.08 TRINITY_DN4186_c0_g2_i1:39-347(-)